MKMLADDTISSKQAKEVFAAIMDEDKDPEAIVEARGMKQVSDTGAIEAVVDEVIAANPDEVAATATATPRSSAFSSASA